MVWIQDTQVSFTISLIPYVEGFGQITFVSVSVTDILSGAVTTYSGTVSYTDSTGSVSWDVSPPYAHPGDTIQVMCDVTNAGEGVDSLYVKMETSIPTSEQVELGDISPGESTEAIFSTITMPNADLSVTLSAGHWYE